MNTEMELNFIKVAKGLLYSHYHGKFLLGGSTDQHAGIGTELSAIDYSDYIANSSGKLL